MTDSQKQMTEQLLVSLDSMDVWIRKFILDLRDKTEETVDLDLALGHLLLIAQIRGRILWWMVRGHRVLDDLEPMLQELAEVLADWQTDFAKQDHGFQFEHYLDRVASPIKRMRKRIERRQRQING